MGKKHLVMTFVMSYWTDAGVALPGTCYFRNNLEDCLPGINK